MRILIYVMLFRIFRIIKKFRFSWNKIESRDSSNDYVYFVDFSEFDETISTASSGRTAKSIYEKYF